MNIFNISCPRLRFAAITALFLTILPSKGAVTIVSGLATAGADVSSGPSQSSPPTGPISPDVFYSSKNVVSAPSDSAGITAEGWATVTWQTGGTSLNAAGSSSQGYNGALGAGGWIYGFGHASFAAGFQFDQTYTYTALNPTANMKGLPGSFGFLPALDINKNKMTYSVSGYTYGNSGGFSVDMSFTPATAAQNNLLNGAISAPQVIGDAVHGYYITFSFVPQDGETIQSAAQTLGVSNLNFVSTIIAIPSSWQITDNDQVVVSANGQFPAGGLPDPLPQASSGSGRVYVDVGSGIPPVHMLYAPDEFDKTTGTYYDISYATSASVNDARPSPYELDFIDSPNKPPGFFGQNGYQEFKTQLVGLDKNGNVIAYFGAPVYWYTSQTRYGSAVFGDSTLPDDPNLGSYFDGGIAVGPSPLTITWTNPVPIPYGTILGSNQLNATASSQGWFAYNPANGSVLNSGTNTLSAVFTPYDTVDYSPVTNAVSIIVAPAALTVIASNTNRAYGQTNPIFTGVISGLTNGDSIGATYSCSATTNSPDGVYPLVPSLVDPQNRATNYAVTFINGTLTVAPAPINLLANPGFELMETGWTFVGDSGVTPAPHTGEYAAFVNIATGIVTQSVETTPGDNYLISFWLSANGYSAPGAIITASLGSVVGFSNTYPQEAFGYQQESFTAVASNTNSPFAFSGIMSGGTFFLDDVSVTALPIPTNGITITSQPASESVFPGQSGSFQVGVSGAGLLNYQWYFNQTNLITNATNSWFVLRAVDPTNAGSYNVTITGTSGSVSSAVAKLSELGVPVSFQTEAGSVQLTNGSFYSFITGLVGQGPVIVEVSTNLTQWTPLQTNAPGFGVIQFIDTNAENYPFRFYRASVPSD